jgi:hypothetical protein
MAPSERQSCSECICVGDVRYQQYSEHKAMTGKPQHPYLRVYLPQIHFVQV